MESLTLQERLINEAKQSPGKAVVLGCGLALAIYMWAPMMMGWTGSEKAVAVQPMETGTTKNAAAESEAEIDEAQWFKLYQDFQQTKLMEPWTPPLVNVSVADSGTVVDAALHLSIDDLEKLSVSAVLIGGRTGHLANLNNRVIREGEQVWIDFSESDPEPTFNPPGDLSNGRWSKLTIARIYSDRIDVTVDGAATTISVRPNRAQ